MSTQDLKLTSIVNTSVNDEEYSIPLDISDIINICREYNKLGSQIQNQVEIILDTGVDQAIEKGYVKRESLPHIKNFLNSICKNAYFGDAVSQAHDCIFLIEEYELKHKPIKSQIN